MLCATNTICAIQGVHPNHFGPSSVQLKGEINGAFLCKRHQQRHLEFCTVYLRTRAREFESPRAHHF